MPGGKFITFEGGEGSGKSTVIQAVAARLRDTGHDVVVTQEPEGTELGRHMWAYFREMAAAGKSVTAEAELFLFAAARAEHVRTVIEPAAAEGKIVLCDRFADSTVAYQGYGRGIDIATVEEVNHIATGGCEPDLTLLLDVFPEEGLRRARSLEGDGTKIADAIGAESLAFHQRVRDGFRALATAHPERFRVIDAMLSLEDVAAAAEAAIDACIAGRSQVDKSSLR